MAFYNIFLDRYEIIGYIVAVIIGLILLIIGFLYQYPGKVVLVMMRVILMLRTNFKIKRLKLAEDFEVEYMERGSMTKHKTSILLVHGFGVSKFNWFTIDKYIPDNMHVVAVDLPGHGGTTKLKDGEIRIENFAMKVKQFCTAIGLDKKKFHLAGSSMGGQTSVLYAIKYPEDLLSLTLVSPGGIKPLIQSKIDEIYNETKRLDIVPLSVEQFKRMGSLAAYNEMQLPEFIIRGYIQLKKESKEYLEKVIQPYYNDEVRFGLTECIQNVQAPTLVVWGKEDKMLHVSAADVIKEKLPTCKVVILDKCGHAVDFDKPKEMAEAMVNFIESITSRN